MFLRSFWGTLCPQEIEVKYVHAHVRVHVGGWWGGAGERLAYAMRFSKAPFWIS